MRGVRARTSLVLFALALGLAGCGDDPAKPGASGSTPSASASAGADSGATGSPADPGGSPGQVPPADNGSGTATGSDKQVCTDQEKITADATQRFGEEVVKAATAENSEQAAVTAVKKLFGEWATGMRGQATKATNPELKGALNEYATGLEKVKDQINGVADLDKLGDLNTAEIESATDKLLRICG